MKNLKGLLAICIVIVFCSFAAAEWVDFKSDAGRFKMKFPRQPVAESQDVESEVTPIKIHMFIYDASKYKDENSVYLAMYCDYPDTLVNSDFKDEIVDTILKGSITGMANNMSGEILSIEVSNYKEFPGRKVKLNLKEGLGFAYVKVYLVHNRMYMMEVLCDPAKDHNASIDKFFDSFSVIDKKPAVKK